MSEDSKVISQLEEIIYCEENCFPSTKKKYWI